MNSLQAMNMGMRPGNPKKPTHRGRKPSTKPGAQHLSALTQAHGVGDLKGAKTAALNYAKAVHAHMSATAPAQSMSEPDADDTAADDMQSAPMPQAPQAPNGPSLARQAMMARKK